MSRGKRHEPSDGARGGQHRGKTPRHSTRYVPGERDNGPAGVINQGETRKENVGSAKDGEGRSGGG